MLKYIVVISMKIERRAGFSVGEDDCVGFSLKWHHLARQLAGCESPIEVPELVEFILHG
jgi:hypothetical protein